MKFHLRGGHCSPKRPTGNVMKLFTVVTVCLNAENDILKTIQSVLDQDFDDFEYLIKDGGSTDQTLEIARSFSADFEKRGIPYRILSRPDSGVYDAMNQAVLESQGQWLSFMNAGDCFASSSILSRVYHSGALENADVVYGDVVYVNHSMYWYVKPQPISQMPYGFPFCHQSTFTRVTMLVSTPFHTEYRICGDYHFFMQMQQQGRRFQYVPFAISKSGPAGISSDRLLNHQEALKMLESMPVREENAIRDRIKRLNAYKRREFFAVIYRKLTPIWFQEFSRQRRRKKHGWTTADVFFSEHSDIAP